MGINGKLDDSPGPAIPTDAVNGLDEAAKRQRPLLVIGLHARTISCEVLWALWGVDPNGMRSSIVDDRPVLLPRVGSLPPFLILLRGGFGGLEHLIMLRLVDTFFDEPFTVTSPFAIFVLVGTFRCLLTG